MHSEYEGIGRFRWNHWRSIVISEKFKEALSEHYLAIMDMQDVMDCLRISRRGAYRLLVEDREIPSWKDEDGNWNVLRDDVIAYIEENGNA
jgi:hypothetical protein